MCCFLPVWRRSTAASSSTAPSCCTRMRSDGTQAHRHHAQGYGGVRRHELKHIRGDFNVAWPTAEIAVRTQRCVEICSERDLRAATKRPRRGQDRGVPREIRAPVHRGRSGYLADIIDPATRGGSHRRSGNAPDKARQESAEETRKHSLDLLRCLEKSSSRIVVDRARVIPPARDGVRTVAVYSEPTCGRHTCAKPRGRLIGPLHRARAISTVTESSRQQSHWRRTIHPAMGSSASGVVRSPVRDAALCGRPPAERSPQWGADIARTLALANGVPSCPNNRAAHKRKEAEKIAKEFATQFCSKRCGWRREGNECVPLRRRWQGTRCGAARSENAFGDDAVYLEKFVTEPRHVEIRARRYSRQHALTWRARVLVQRRHRKIEKPERRVTRSQKKMGDTAVGRPAPPATSRGHCEFLLDTKGVLLPRDEHAAAGRASVTESSPESTSFMAVRIAAGESSRSSRRIFASRLGHRVRITAKRRSNNFLHRLPDRASPSADGRASGGTAHRVGQRDWPALRSDARQAIVWGAPCAGGYPNAASVGRSLTRAWRPRGTSTFASWTTTSSAVAK